MPPPVQRDIIPVNGWIIEIDGLSAPHFHKLAGLSKKTGTLEVVDGGTNRKYFFSDGVQEHGSLTFTRTRDKSPDDAAFIAFQNEYWATGAKLDGQLIQFRFGTEILRINFQGLGFNEMALTDFDTMGSDKSDIIGNATCDWWEFEDV